MDTEPPPGEAPPETVRPGNTLWARPLGAVRGLDVEAAPDGSLALLAADDDPSGFDGQSVGGDLVLARYDPSGTLLEAKGMSAPGASKGRLARTPDGYYVMAEVTSAANLGCGPIDATSASLSSVVARLSADGSCHWAMRQGYLRSLSRGADDGLWLLGDYDITRYDGAGAFRAHQSTVEMVGGRGNIDLHTMVRLNDGGAVFGGTSNGEMRLEGRSWSGQVVPVLFRMAADGRVVWVRPFPEVFGYISAVQVTPAGTILALGSFNGQFQWAGARASSNGLSLLALEANGAELWARPVGGQVGATSATRMAVDAAGAVVVMAESPGACGGSGLMLAKVDAAGAFLWQRHFAPAGCVGEVRGHALATLPSREIMVTGAFSGQVSFGSQVLEQRPGGRTEAFLLKLAP
jgi:outer membrane protein assembly factor BamB